MVDSLEMQNSLKKAVTVSGIGIFSGEEVSVTIHPAPVDTGIVFRRVDLENSPDIPAHVDFVQESSRCTRIGSQGVSITMVEHLVSALYACEIDNALIEVKGPEIPGSDGSSLAFVNLFNEVGVQPQDKPANLIEIEQTVSWSQGSIHLIAIPSKEFKLSYTMHYPQSKLLGSQYYSLVLSPDRYRQEIAPCRTFSLYEEIIPLLEKGLIKGGALANAVVIKEDKIVNPEGTRFPNEMVRHKVLDLIGDLSLVGSRIRAHIIAICSGHASNIAFAKTLLNALPARSY